MYWQFVGRLGKVDHLNDKGNLVVCYHGELKKWVISPDAVVKVGACKMLIATFHLHTIPGHLIILPHQVELPDLAPGDTVRILDDGEKVMSLQLSAGIEWTEDTCDVS